MYLSKFANEESTFVVNVILKDEDGVVITPKTLEWGLYDNQGTVINSRQNVVIATPESSNNIVLKGDDLSIISDDMMREERVLQVDATYDSIYGSDLPHSEEFRFFVQNLKGTV